MKELIARLRAALLILGFGLAATGCDGGPTPMASEGEELVPAEAASMSQSRAPSPRARNSASAPLVAFG